MVVTYFLWWCLYRHFCFLLNVISFDCLLRLVPVPVLFAGLPFPAIAGGAGLTGSVAPTTLLLVVAWVRLAVVPLSILTNNGT